jgi:hypothetical protein
MFNGYQRRLKCASLLELELETRFLANLGSGGLGLLVFGRWRQVRAGHVRSRCDAEIYARMSRRGDAKLSISFLWTLP